MAFPFGKLGALSLSKIKADQYIYRNAECSNSPLDAINPPSGLQHQRIRPREGSIMTTPNQADTILKYNCE
jgi:hypothetical protein